MKNEHNIDIYGAEIREGDWLVLASQTSGMPTFRFGKVGAFTSTGKPKIAAFMYFDETYEEQGWDQYYFKLIPVAPARKTWRIEESQLPQGLRDFIQNEYHGDPFFKTKQSKKETTNCRLE